MPKYRFTEIAFNSTAKKKPTEADKDAYIGLEHLDSGTLTVSRWGSDVAPIGEKLIMKKGDILFGKRRAYQKKVGIAPFDGIFSAHGMVLRPREEVITKEYFPLFISSDYFLDEAIRISVGSLSPTVNWKDLKDLEFNIPTIEEQRRITPLVWAAIETKNAYKSLISGIDDLVKSQFIEMIYTQGYPSVKVGEVLHQTLKTERIVDTLKEKYVTVALHGLGARERNIDVYDPKPFSAYRIKAGQFIYSRIDARNGAFSIIPEVLDGAVVSKDFPVFDIDTTKIMPQMLLFSMLDENFIQQIKQNSLGSTNRQRIKEDVFLEYQIVLPPIDVQQAFEAFVKQSDKSKFELEQAIQKVDNLIKSLISQE